MNAAAGVLPARHWLGEFLLLSALWGASFLFMRLGASEFGPLPTAG
ncbi:EamA family transporter, partial [Paracidovorax avenae]